MNKENNKFMAAWILALLLWFTATAFAVEPVPITGTVYPVGWDDSGHVAEAVIVSVDRDYLIVKDAIGRELHNMAYRDVKVIGHLAEDSDGNLTVTVVEYEVLMEDALRGHGE